MEDIHIIYKNSFGVTFLWKRNTITDINRIQVVFKEIGLYLNYKELNSFKKLTSEAYNRTLKCQSCSVNKNCKQLLETPFKQISFAATQQEIKQINDLLEGTLFEIEMERLLIQHGIK